MPLVRIAWYSTEELWRYHVCANCQHNSQIMQGRPSFKAGSPARWLKSWVETTD